MNSRIEIVEGDITKLDVDAIVNAASTSLLGGNVNIERVLLVCHGPEAHAVCKTVAREA